MRRLRIVLVLQIALVSLVGPETFASQFVVFPKASELVSPDGRLAVRSIDSQGSASDFAGTFHSLWLFELATGGSRKLCDYLGVASAAWSGNDWLVVTQYVGKRTSRALVFSATAAEDPVMLDKITLTQLIPADLARHYGKMTTSSLKVRASSTTLSIWQFGDMVSTMPTAFAGVANTLCGKAPPPASKSVVRTIKN